MLAGVSYEPTIAGLYRCQRVAQTSWRGLLGFSRVANAAVERAR